MKLQLNMVNRIYYRLLSDDIPTLFKLKDGYFIKVYKPVIGCLSIHTGFKLIYVLWYILTIGNFKIYYVLDKTGRIIHFSHVMSKIYKYAFMPRINSIHIGPCWTHELHRGKGIYPAVLSKICSDYKEKNIYIFTKKENIASQKGIEKVGFKQFATGIKTKRLGIYIIKNVL